MYQEIFNQNFFFNFLSGFIFILFTYFVSLSISNHLKVKKIRFFEEFQTIIIFFSIFISYSLIFNLIILGNFFKFFDLVFFFLIFAQIIYFFLYLKYFHFKNFYFNKLKVLDIFILIFLIILFLISILPISDADSIALHQNLSNYIYNNGIENINFQKNISFTIFSNTQNLLILSPLLKSDNLGSQLNFAILLFFLIINFRNHKNFLLILLSCPLIIYFISAQKLQLFFGILYLLIFILIDRKYFKSKIELFFIILLIVFYSSGNLSYTLFAIPLYIYLFLKKKDDWKNIILFSIISFLIILFPIFLTKQIYYSNFLAPFFDNILGKNNDFYNAYAYAIRSTDGWLGNPLNLKLYLKPFITFNLNQLSSSLGLIFLLMLLDINLLKRTKFFPLIIIFLVLVTGQILPRYYFEAFLILAFFFKFKNIFAKFLVGIFGLGIFSISVIFVYISYFNHKVVFDKNDYMNIFSHSYFDSTQIKNLNISDNILDFSLSTQSTFLDDNVFSIRALSHLQNYKQDTNYLTKYLKDNSIKYIIIDQPKKIPSCISYVKSGETNRRVAVRNFLRNEKISVFKVLKIISNNC